MKIFKKELISRSKLFTLPLFLPFLCFSGSLIASDPDDRVVIDWPSIEYRTIQSAIDALPDNGVLKIAAGRYVVDEPIVVTEKKIIIEGAGSGIKIKKRGYKIRNNTKRSTQLIGREPLPVLGADRNVILPADRAQGVVNLVASDTVVRDIAFSGFDAGIVIKDSAEGVSGTTNVSNVYINETGRGIAALSSGDLFVESSVIAGTLWHGIIKSPPTPVINKVHLHKTYIGDPGGAAAYFNGAYGVISEGDVAGGLEGGVVCYECELYVVNSHIYDNHKAGILLLLAKNTSYISNNLIENIKPDFFYLNFGDGITSFLSKIHLWGNQINNVPRAGVANFGGHAALGNNLIQCFGYELEGEPYFGNPYSFDDHLGNYCGCPNAAGSCVVSSAGLEPPEPAAPVE